MKKFWLLAVLVLALLVLPARPIADASWSPAVYNWGSGWCSTCYVQGYVDIPSSGTGWTGYLAGWAFMQYNGSPITNAYVYVDGVNQAISIYPQLYRPDVGAFSGNDYDGWAIYFQNTLPSGRHTISVVLWYGMVSSTITGVVDIP
jgi:hypothetical protein